mgnify:CR=1 FL=1
MQLIVNGQFVDNPWQDCDQLSDFGVLPLERLQQLLDGGNEMPRTVGLNLSAADGVDVDSKLFADLSLIVIEFDSHNDGRGYSIAASLRSAGFDHELRARGALLSDQYPQLRACGFDSIEIPDELAERHTALDWLKAYRRFPQRYQTTPASLGSVLEQRHRAPGERTNESTLQRHQHSLLQH